MRATREGICSLCRTPKELCESHIVPEFMYKPVYADHRMIGFKKNDSGVKPWFHQKGFREHLLCVSCEGHLNKFYEHPHVSTWEALCRWQEQSSLKISYGVSDQGMEFADVEGVDYSSFKLLLLSILWRASRATRREYRSVTLGPYEEKIRQMLLQGNPGPQKLFPCVVTLLKKPVRLITGPAKGRYAGHTTYQFIVTNVVLWFFISNRTEQEAMLGRALKEDGSFQALVSEPEEIPVYNKTMQWLRRTKASLS